MVVLRNYDENCRSRLSYVKVMFYVFIVTFQCKRHSKRVEEGSPRRIEAALARHSKVAVAFSSLHKHHELHTVLDRVRPVHSKLDYSTFLFLKALKF